MPTARSPSSPPQEEREAWEVERELHALLAASGRDVAAFVAGLGVAYEGGARGARRACLLRYHPDKLRGAGRREQLRGLAATRLLLLLEKPR